jgi:transcriptional regulator with XRE-family HTH domain
MIERGYNLTARGGGQRRLAEKTGISPATVSRLLNGEALNPDPESLRAIADVLALPFGDVLIQFGVLTADELGAIHDSPVTVRPPITPEQAAAELGITDPAAVAVFTATVTALQHQRPGDQRAE